MSLLIELSKDSPETGYLVVVRPRYRQESWSVYSGNTYVCDWDKGYVYKVYRNGVELTGAASLVAIGSTEFYYDHEGQKLYFDNTATPGVGPDDDNVYMVVHYEIAVSDKDVYFYRDPLDDTSTEVFYSGSLLADPVVKQDLSDVILGYMPTQSSAIQIQNRENEWDKLIHDSSFYRAEIEIYCYAGALIDENIERIYTGLVASQSYKDEVVTLQMLDRNAVFRDGFDGSFYQAEETGTELSDLLNVTGFINVIATDPAFIGRPKNLILGVVDGVRAVNLTYSDIEEEKRNRAWAVANEATRSNGYGKEEAISYYNSAVGSSSTTTRTYLDSVHGYKVGDYPLFEKTGTFTHRRLVTAVVEPLLGDPYLEHDALPSALAAGHKVHYCHTGWVKVIMDGDIYPLTAWEPYRDDTCSFILLNNGYDTTDSLPRKLNANDTVFCRVYGSDTLPTIGGVDFGAIDNESQCLIELVPTLYRILKDYIGIPEDEINTASFEDVRDNAPAGSVEISYRAPINSSSDYPTYSEIISTLLLTGPVRLFQNEDQLWTLSAFEPIGTSDYFATEDDFDQDSMEHQYIYDDILSDVVVEYGQQEISENLNEATGRVLRAYASNLNAKYLHGISRQRTFVSARSEELGAQDLADKLCAIFSDRRCQLSAEFRAGFFLTHPGNVLEVTAKKLPGFSNDGTTEQTRQYVVMATDKTLTSVKVTAEDQRGIENNSSLF